MARLSLTPMSRDCVRKMIENGHLIVILNQKVLRLDNWVRKHPGGRLPILHMVGKDASDQIVIYHSAETLYSISRYQIGRITEPWIDMEPPISTDPGKGSGEVNNKISRQGETWIDEKKEQTATISVSEVSEDKQYDVVPVTFAALAEQEEKEDIARALREYPSLDVETQRGITRKFRELHANVTEQGLYDCNYSGYCFDICRYVLLFSLFVLTLTHGYIITSAVFLGCFWQQIMFVAHDAGHLAITHNVVVDTIIGVAVADLFCGLSIGWWKSSHNVHHLVPNHPKHDPDIQNLPVFSISPTFFVPFRSTYYDWQINFDAASAFMIRIQKYTYYPIMFFARFNLYQLSWQHVVLSLPFVRNHMQNRKHRTTPTATLWILYLELTCMAIYWYFYINLIVSIPAFSKIQDPSFLCRWTTRTIFVILSHGISLLLHVQITLSHFGMSTADLGPSEAFAQKQLRTTMDVDCPAWLDWVHGGLQFQAVHHLFPRMPKHNYREAQKLVRVFCRETGIPYTIFGFVEGNKVVLGRLGEIAKQVDMFRKCQKHMLEKTFVDFE